MIPRRTVVKGLAAGIPLAAILTDPALARAAADETRLTKIKSAGGRDIAAAVAMPAAVPAPVIMLVHEWWGLNDQIKAVAADLARQGFVAVAIDLFDGRVADNPEDARQLVGAVKEADAADTVSSWIQWMKNHQDGNRKTATIGWCFGGGWSLKAATQEPVDATVVYYGRVNLPPERLRRLKGPVLGHFGTRDQFVTPDVVREFEKSMTELGKPYMVYWYEAEHAFANPTGDAFRKEDARVSWERTTAFLKRALAG